MRYSSPYVEEGSLTVAAERRLHTHRVSSLKPGRSAIGMVTQVVRMYGFPQERCVLQAEWT